MEFGLVEMDGGYSLVGRMAIMFVYFVLIFLVYSAIMLFIHYRRLWRYAQLLGQPLLTYFKTGRWDPAELSAWRETKKPEFMIIVEALRKELHGRAPISICSAIKQALDLLAGPFKSMAYLLQVLGWSACLVIWLGALWQIHPGFRYMTYEKDPVFALLAGAIAEVVLMLFVGMAVGLACLWVSSFARGRLSFIHRDLSNRILAASAQNGREIGINDPGSTSSPAPEP